MIQKKLAAKDYEINRLKQLLVQKERDGLRRKR